MLSDTVIIIFLFIFGLVLGSFLNVCIYRIPLKKSVIYPPSHCPECGEKIHFYDNIPLISYMILAGKCRHCLRAIPVRYPLVELMTGLLSVSLFVKYGLSLSYFLFLIFTASLIALSFIDLYHRIIPDVVSIPGIVFGLIVSFFIPSVSWYDSLIGIIAGGGILYLVAVVFEWVTKKEGMGGGDIKLLAMIGAWMGWKPLPFIILISSLVGAIIGGGSLVFTGQGLRTRIPFGPFLALGALVYLFFGRELVAWYLRFIRFG